jgi:hypothetical protein
MFIDLWVPNEFGMTCYDFVCGKLAQVAYPTQLACTHLPDRGSDTLTHEYVQ